MMRTRVVSLLVPVLVAAAISAQTVGYLTPRQGVYFTPPTPGEAVTLVDFSHPAGASASLTTATVRWFLPVLPRCDGAMKLKFLRPTGGVFGAINLIAERGPFDVVHGSNTVALTPPVNVVAGDFVAVTQLSGAACGGMTVAGSEQDDMLINFAGDFAGGTFSGGSLRPGFEGSVLASADPSSLAGVLPVAGSTRGGFGSNFKTAMQLTNATDTAIKGTLVFHPAGRSGVPTDPSLVYTIPSFSTVGYDDVVAAMSQSGLGSIDVMATNSNAPIMTARIYNDTGVTGTSGFTEEVFTPGKALQQGQVVYLAVPADVTNFRLNIGVRALANGATIGIGANDSSGVTLANGVFKTYPANWFEQTSAQDFLGGVVLPPNSFIYIGMSAGSAYIYGSTTDNRTNDSSIQFATQK